MVDQVTKHRQGHKVRRIDEIPFNRSKEAICFGWEYLLPKGLPDGNILKKETARSEKRAVSQPQPNPNQKTKPN